LSPAASPYRNEGSTFNGVQSESRHSTVRGNAQQNGCQIMILQGRNLTQGLTGADVGELHQALGQLGFTVPSAEQQALSFGAGTLSAVQQFQKQQGLTVSGTVDAATAAALSAVILSSTYSVTGTVASPTRPGTGGLTVTLVDKNIGGDVMLAIAATNAFGGYAMSVVLLLPTLQARHKTKPDLQVRVSAGKSFLAASVVRYDAPQTLVLDVALPADAAGLASEYETLMAGLATAYTGKLGALQESAVQQDITFLGNKIGWDARAVALAVLADQFSQITAPPAPTGTGTTATPAGGTVTPAPVVVAGRTTVTPAVSAAPAPARTVTPGSATTVATDVMTNTTTNVVTSPVTTVTPAGLQPEFYYALFRAGLPADADVLFQASAATVQGVWQQAIAQGVIPQALTSTVPAAVLTFQALSAAHVLGAKPPIGPSTLQAMLATNLTDASQQRQFAQLYAQHRDDRAGFWTAVQQTFGTAQAKQLQLSGQLFYLTLNNAPLVTALAAAEKQSPLASTLDLATRGYYDPAKWTSLIGNAIPAEIPGASADAQRANYASLLSAQVRLAFPTAVLADQVARGVMKITDTAAVATDIHDFLTANQGKFEMGLEPVEAYIARSKLGGTSAAVVTQIKRLQRVYQLTPDDQSMTVLLGNQLDSAYAVTRYDSAGFVRAFAQKLGGEATATAIHARAKQVFNAVLNLTVGYLVARAAPTLGGATPIHIPFMPPAANPSYPVIAYPTLENLFGSLDYCDCPDCRSILSPAAYLVDLLYYLDQPAPTAGYQNPQSALLARRPDLQYLPLTCENTNTAMPYIDIINETLEYFVANSLSLANFQGHDTGEVVTSAELLANPQYVNDAAYATLKSAFFPPPLPFDRSLTLLRLHLHAIGAALPDAMAALRASDAVERGSAAYGWRDILLEQLAVSRDEYRLFADTTLKLQDLYGYSGVADATVLAALQTMNLQAFSRRTAVSYDDLFAILKTTFVNPGAAVIPRLQRLGASFATLQALKTDPSTAAQFKSALPAGLDATQYGGASASDYDAVVAWVTDPANYARIMGLIMATDPSGGPDKCSAAALQLRYANPDNNANKLRQTDLVKLMVFIRLWRKLGLTIAQTDDVLAALYPAANMPSGTNDTANLAMLASGFQVFLPRLGFVMQVMSRLGLTADTALAPLLACWAPIDTTGAHSLYATMFLTPTLVQQDAAFADNGYGVVLGSGTEKLMAHQATLCAAFNLTGAEFALIVAALGFDSSTVLTLANISAVFRTGWLAHALGMSVVEFLLLRRFTGLDPFGPLDPATTAPAEPPAIRFIRLRQAFADAGLQPVQALYLIWNQDISGKSAPPLANITGLARTLRTDFAAVDTQFAVGADPDGSIAKGLMTLVYGSTASDFFFGLLNNTLLTAVAYGNPQPILAQAIIDASTGRLAYDDLRKQLSFAGVLDAATRTAVDLAISNNDNAPPLHAALASLAAANQQTVGPFFASYGELLPLYTAYVASGDSSQTKRATLLQNFLPSLKQKRKQQQALAAVTAAAESDPGFATALLQDVTILHAAAQTTLAASSDLTALETQGLSAQFFLANNTALAPDQTIDAAGGLTHTPATNPLPPGQGGSAIAGIWSGFIDVPQDGYYNISVAADAGTAVTLSIDGASVTMQSAGGVWSNSSPISLTAGALTAIVLTVTSLKTTLSVSWQTVGLGWQPIPDQYLYSATLVDRLRTTYVRFLKATALASALSLDAGEIAWLGTAASFAVNATDAKDKLAAGTVTFTPSSMSNIAVGSALVIDAGAAQETVTLTAITATSFTAVTTKPHDGTTTPFAIVSAAFPRTGQGWLNFLAVAQAPTAADATSLGDVLLALLAFARMKAALSPSDERLLAVLKKPTLTLLDGSSALLALTGWAQDSVNALLMQFFGDMQPGHLAIVENFRRVYDAYAIVKTCRVSAAALLAAITNAPTAATVGALQSALRALYAEPDWLTVVRPINDAMRIRQRDALVAYVLQHLGDAYAKLLVVLASTADTPTGTANVSFAGVAGVTAGMLVQGVNIAPGTTVASVSGNTVTLSLGVVADLPAGSSLTFVPANAVEIDTPDKLFEYFLIDVETQPPVETSRIRLALSAVQLFIERVLRNLEPQVSPNDIDGSLWSWMKRYRVWQANREVFLWPENWLYPELRDDQSPFFQEIMSGLLQGDITDDAASAAYLDYLTKLEAVAKLEPCGLYYIPAVGDTRETAYVVARSAGAARKYYFRQLQDGGWTPWTEVKIDCEDMPLTPIVWNGRLFLFWLKILKQTSPQSANLPSSGSSHPQQGDNVAGLSLGAVQTFAQASSQAQQNEVIVQAVLCWSEFYSGKWQPTKTSDVNRPTMVGIFPATGPHAFDPDRSIMRLIPSLVTVPSTVPPEDPALAITIYAPLATFPALGGFLLHNTHSLPVGFGDAGPITSPKPDKLRTLGPLGPYTGGSQIGTFGIAYYTFGANAVIPTETYTNQIIGFTRTPRFVEPQPSADAWDAPFFYEDRRNLFYVTTSESYRTIWEFNGFGLLTAYPSLAGGIPKVPPLVVPPPPFAKPRPVEIGPAIGPVAGGGDPAVVKGFLAQSDTIRAALGSTLAVSFQGRQIYPSGSTVNPATTVTTGS
jgi:hypothetical protein